MKKKYSITTLFVLLFSLAGICQNPNDIVNIPDPILKDFLVNHYYTMPDTITVGAQLLIKLDANGDGEIQYSEAESYTSWKLTKGFNLTDKGISDLTGIEAFKSIEELYLIGNPLTEIDVSGCTSLKRLFLGQNLITSFELHSSILEEVSIGSNPNLTTVDLSGCSGLKNINIGGNDILESVDIKNSNSAEEIRINYNPVLNNLEMNTSFSFHSLTLFLCNGNGLTSLDVSKCPVLQIFTCNGNPNLASLNLATGHPTTFQQINATNNPNLTCVQVDNAPVAEFIWANYPYEFDDWATFSEDCTPPGPCIVNIPDVNLKNYLLANTAINTNGNDKIECGEAQAYTGDINLDNIAISDLTGIEAFVNISSFSANSIQTTTYAQPHLVESIDLSNFTSLTSVSISNNVALSSVNLSNCSALSSLNVAAHPSISLSLNLSNCTGLTNLDVKQKHLNELILTGCTNLTDLDCSDNQLTALNVNESPNLVNLNFSRNEIGELNINNNTHLVNLNGSYNELIFIFTALNTALEDINLSFNNLTYLDVGNNTNLIKLNCSNNELNTILVNNNQVLENLDCSHNHISQLFLDNNIALKIVNADYNELTDINVNQLINLTKLSCSYNLLSQVDISDNQSLESLVSSGNNLPDIDVSQNSVLKSLFVSNNQLTELDLTANLQLIQLDASQNLLTNLNMGNNANVSVVMVSENQLSSLDLSHASLLFVLDCSDNDLQSLNLANGANGNLFNISAINNPNLTCIQVDDANYSNVNWVSPAYKFDPWANFNAGQNTSISLSETSFCSNQSEINLDSIVSFSGGIFSGNGVNDNKFDPAEVGNGTHSLIYTVSENGCIDTATFEITVEDSLTVTFDLATSDICIDGAIIELSSISPTGGIFSGDGIVNYNHFDPSQTGAGVHTITYQATNSAGCNGSTTQQIVVHDLPTVLFELDNSEICENENPIVLKNFVNLLGGDFSGEGINNGVFNPSEAEIGTNNITYTYTDSFGCTNTASQNLVVLEIPNPTIEQNNHTLTTGSFSSYQWYNCENNQPIQGATQSDFSPLTNGIYAVEVSNASGCKNISDCIEYSTTGLKLLSKQNIQVYPNPTKGVIYIQSDSEINSLKLINQTGQIVLEKKLETEQLNISELAKGVYTIVIKTDNNSTYHKIIKE